MCRSEVPTLVPNVGTVISSAVQLICVKNTLQCHILKVTHLGSNPSLIHVYFVLTMTSVLTPFPTVCLTLNPVQGDKMGRRGPLVSLLIGGGSGDKEVTILDKLDNCS